MSRNSDIYGNIGERLVIAPGSVVGITTSPGQIAVQVKLLSGGTLEIGGATGVNGNTFGSLYPISANEVISQNNSGKFYLWASSATCTVAILRGTSAGV